MTRLTLNKILHPRQWRRHKYATRPRECHAEDPLDGFICTEPLGHDGDHVACDEEDGECARWADTWTDRDDFEQSLADHHALEE